MKIFFDTEFIEDGKTIDLLSIGLVREDGAHLYLENAEADFDKASNWVVDNVYPHLDGITYSRQEIADEIVAFVGTEPELWAYYADYDWVVLCQLFGRMIDLPKGWPMFCRDLRQLAETKGVRVKQENSIHNALDDARWVKATYEAIS